MNLKIIISLSLLTYSILLIPENQTINLNTSLLNEEEYFINDMSESDFINNSAERLDNFFNLEKENNTYCNLCKSGMDILLNTMIQEYRWGILHTLCTMICSIALRKDICSEAVARYGPVVIESTLKRLFNSESFCSSLYICNPSIEYESIEEYAKRILKNKNPKKKEDKNIKINITQSTKEFRFAQITDTHLQLDYQEGKVINCNIPLCCRNTPEEIGFKNNKNHKNEDIRYSLKYGASGKCDSNIEVLKAFAKEVKKEKIDFILFTGDFSAHDVWEVQQENITKITQISVDIMSSEIGPDIPIYPAIGNHEKAPPDVFMGSETILLHGFGKVFRKYLTQEAYDTFSQYGYYTMLHKDTNLRLVSLNCILCNSMNFHLISHSYQVAKMFKWLENVMSEAEKNNERVYLLDHIPMFSSQHSYDCTMRLKIIIERYKDIISGYFSGHTHKDELTLVKEYTNPKKYSTINYICPGLTTYSQYWPSYRIYIADNYNKNVKDYIQWRLNLDESNKIQKPIWFISYQATKFYNVTSMDDYDIISKANIDANYAKKVLTDNPENEEEYTNNKFIENVKCDFDNDNYVDSMKCKSADFDGEIYLHYALNVLFKKWPKV